MSADEQQERSQVKPDLTMYLGQVVHVVVDRPLGSCHPRHPLLRYEVNYGEIPGTVSGDGHPIDVYLVGWDEPLESTEAEVVAVVVRRDDTEDKLIAGPPGRVWTTEELLSAIHFQERFFDISLVNAATRPFGCNCPTLLT